MPGLRPRAVKVFPEMSTPESRASEASAFREMCSRLQINRSESWSDCADGRRGTWLTP